MVASRMKAPLHSLQSLDKLCMISLLAHTRKASCNFVAASIVHPLASVSQDENQNPSSIDGFFEAIFKRSRIFLLPVTCGCASDVLVLLFFRLQAGKQPACGCLQANRGAWWKMWLIKPLVFSSSMLVLYRIILMFSFELRIFALCWLGSCTPRALTYSPVYCEQIHVSCVKVSGMGFRAW